MNIILPPILGTTSARPKPRVEPKKRRSSQLLLPPVIIFICIARTARRPACDATAVTTRRRRGSREHLETVLRQNPAVVQQHRGFGGCALCCTSTQPSVGSEQQALPRLAFSLHRIEGW